MNRNDQELAHYIKMKFGTAPNNPSPSQLDGIKSELLQLVNQGKTPTQSEWLTIVKKYCPEAGSYIYKGADSSDLITLLQLATKK